MFVLALGHIVEGVESVILIIGKLLTLISNSSASCFGCRYACHYSSGVVVSHHPVKQVIALPVQNCVIQFAKLAVRVIIVRFVHYRLLIGSRQLIAGGLQAIVIGQSHLTRVSFPSSRPNVRFRDASKFRKPHAWDIGKRFRRIRDLAGIKDLRIHDLRHFATTMLFIEGVSDAIIRKMTGHRSEELERYKHLSPSFSQQTTELIAGKLVDELDKMSTFSSPSSEDEKTAPEGGSENTDNKDYSGGADGTRTRDLQRDRWELYTHRLRLTISLFRGLTISKNYAFA
jgi:hypothetical protein